MKDWNPQQIKKLREKLGITQMKFAELLGVTRIHVNYLEKGTRSPSKTMCRLLNCIEREHKSKKNG